MTNLKEGEMANLVQEAENKNKRKLVTEGTVSSSVVSQIRTEKKDRKFLVIGTGDAGANIASTIKDATNQFVIIYNTSKRALDRLKCDKAIVPDSEDGSGKDRSFSKEIFKNGPHNTMLETVREQHKIMNFDYITVSTSSDGGTGGGVSPNVAKFLKDNTAIPTIVIGVYPTLLEDPKAQFNTLAWQNDIEKTKLPYFVFDNNKYHLSKVETHEKINTDIAAVMKVLTGQVYGDTNILAIDDRDIFKMVSHGKRMAVYTSTRRPKMNESLDSYIIDMITESSQPEPLNPASYALFIKGPEDMIKSLDTSLIGIRDKYGSELEKFQHIEISDEIQITLMASGCEAVFPRLKQIRTMYDEHMASRKSTGMSAGSFIEGVSDPFSAPKTGKYDENAKTVKDALDI